MHNTRSAHPNWFLNQIDSPWLYLSQRVIVDCCAVVLPPSKGLHRRLLIEDFLALKNETKLVSFAEKSYF